MLISLSKAHHGPNTSAPLLTDCCDGSDEQKGCTNTCLDKSAGALLSLQQRVASYSHLLVKKASNVQEASLRRHVWASRAPTIDVDITTKKQHVETIRGTDAMQAFRYHLIIQPICTK